MRKFCAVLAAIGLLAVPAMSVELYRYRGAAKDGGTLEYLFEASEQNSPNAITKEKAAEIAADFMTTFYHVQVGAMVGQRPAPSGWICFSDTQRPPSCPDFERLAIGAKERGAWSMDFTGISSAPLESVPTLSTRLDMNCSRESY